MTESSDIAKSINSTLSSRGAPYSTYSAKPVSWDDVSRGTVGSGLSCLGANITDTYLRLKDGTSLFTVRSDNWNERLGAVAASDVMLLTGNCESPSNPLRRISLADFLADPAACGASYAGMADGVSLADKAADAQVSVRFQTVFLPLPEDGTGDKPNAQFAAEAYNYQTTRDDDPRNLVLLATSQGLALQADGAGAKRLLHHGFETGADAETAQPKQFWLEAESSRHSVGGEQKETEQERAEAVRRGKAVSETIGVAQMGTRFNALLTVQIPIEQVRVDEESEEEEDSGVELFSMNQKLSLATQSAHFECGSVSMPKASWFMAAPLGAKRYRKMSKPGVSSAARVSRGEMYGPVEKLSNGRPTRQAQEHVTVTIVFYNAVVGGLPSAEDVVAAIDDLEKLYTSCAVDGKLGEKKFDFMKTELTVNDVLGITNKISTQPPVVSNLPKPDEGTGAGEICTAKRIDGKFESILVDTGAGQFEELQLMVRGALQGSPHLKLVESKMADIKELESEDGGMSQEMKDKLSELRLLCAGALSK